MKRKGRLLLGVVVLPILVYAVLVWWIDVHGAATLILGAAAGSSALAIVPMGAALLLRLYTVLALPGIIAFAVVHRLVTLVTFSRPKTSTSTPGQ
jgi:hypothetical protein